MTSPEYGYKYFKIWNGTGFKQKIMMFYLCNGFCVFQSHILGFVRVLFRNIGPNVCNMFSNLFLNIFRMFRMVFLNEFLCF